MTGQHLPHDHGPHDQHLHRHHQPYHMCSILHHATPACRGQGQALSFSCVTWDTAIWYECARPPGKLAIDWTVAFHQSHPPVGPSAAIDKIGTCNEHSAGRCSSPRWPTAQGCPCEAQIHGDYMPPACHYARESVNPSLFLRTHVGAHLISRCSLTHSRHFRLSRIS